MENTKSEDCYPNAETMKTETKKLKTEKIESEERKLKAAKDILNNVIKSENDGDKAIRNQVLKRKFTEDGAAIERVLSEGETSSGFETVSSINSNDIGDLDDLELSSLNDCGNESENSFNVIVQIENELAYRNIKEPENRNFYRSKYNSPVHKHKKDYYSNEHTKNRLHKDRCRRKICQYSNCEHKYYKCAKRDRWSSERETTDNSRQLSCCQYERHTQDWKRKSIWSDSRSRHSRSSERTFRCKNSRSPERKVVHRSSNIKDRKAESRHSGSFDKYSSNPRRNSPVRKRRRSSFSRSPSSVWSRLDSHSNPTREKKERTTHNRNSVGKSSRKRERTPFLVELERKLKEAERSKKEAKTMLVSDTVPVPQVPSVMKQNLTPQCPLTLPTVPYFEGVYHLQYQLMPALSVDNLPLVPGPTGLPVHITPTGEQIPHDMDGKRIPVGPNGFYLPVDPTGRLFPHIVSPVNQAIPIHRTDDGVLRLPDSEPVPYGLPHQFPVNVDGSIIYIGPDSKPLYPCPNLPRTPPLHLLKIINAVGKNAGTQGAAQEMPQMVNQQVAPAQSKPQPQQSTSQFRAQSLGVDLTVPVTTKNPPEANCIEDLLKKQKQIEEEKTKNDLMNTETDNNLNVSPSIAAVKRSIPVKLCQSKAPRNNFHSSAPEVILESNGSVPEVKSSLDSGEGSNEDVTVTQNKEQSFVEVVHGNKSFTIPNAGLNSDDPIVRKTEQAIKSLSEKNYKPPVFGRFIISGFSSGLVARKFPYESPLLRNRIKLPFVTPNAKDFYCLNQPVSVKKTKITFKFLSQKSERGGRLSDCKQNGLCNTKATKLPVFTFDFAMQCDFTSVIIRNLNSKVSELESEVVRLKKANANLLEDCRNAQAVNEKKSDELRKALLEIQERNSEILTLKCSLKVQQ